MPELPEVETMCRGIRDVEGAIIRNIKSARCRCRPITIEPKLATLSRRARYKRIANVERLGKRVILRLENEHRIVFEPRMTGLVLVEEPPSLEHLRIIVELEESNVERLLFWDRRGLGTFRLYAGETFRTEVQNKLGPDAIRITAEQMRERFKESKREIKVALLDQKLVAGIGNLYASEILHQARVGPKRKCNGISKNEWARIHAANIDILQKAITYEGSTLSDGTYRNALNDSGNYQNEHRVYDRAGQKCPSCRQGTIQRIVQAQRSTFFCKFCQSRSNPKNK